MLTPANDDNDAWRKIVMLICMLFIVNKVENRRMT